MVFVARCLSCPSLQQQVQDAVDKGLERHEDCHGPPMSGLVLETHKLLQHNSRALQVRQMASYLCCALKFALLDAEGLRDWENAPLPLVEKFPALTDCAGELTCLIASSLPVHSWGLLVHASKIMLKGMKGSKEVVAMLSNLRKIAEQEGFSQKVFSEMIDSEEEFPADPRFSVVSVKTKDPYNPQHLESVANKLAIFIWRTLVKTRPSDFHSTEDKTKGRSLLQISKAIHEKKLDKKAALHPSIPFLYIFLERLDKFIRALTETQNHSIVVPDDKWVMISSLLRWRDRLFQVCCEVVETKAAFRVFFPKLVMHWQLLHDCLSKSIPEEWFDSCKQGELLLKTHNKLILVFSQNCGPVHDLALNLGQLINHPRPFSTKNQAKVFLQLQEVTKSLKPNLKEESLNVFLSTDEGSRIRREVVATRIISMFKSGDLVQVKTIRKEASEAVANVSSSCSKLQAKFQFLKIQTWPVIEYIINHMLMWNFAGQNQLAQLDQTVVEDLVSLSKFVPLDVLECLKGQRQWAMANLYALESKSAASRNPEEWVTYPNILKTAETEELLQELNIPVKIYSPVSSLLTVILSRGASGDALLQLKVGLHSEKSEQLNAIRATIWDHWKSLAHPDFSPKALFFTSVTEFVSDFINNLNSVFPSVDYESLTLREKANILSNPIRENCGTDVVQIYEIILSTLDSLSSSQNELNLTALAKLGAASACLQGWILGHLQSMDPAGKSKILLDYAYQDKHRLQQEIMQHSWIDILRGGKASSQFRPSDLFKNAEHPHLVLRKEHLQKAVTDVDSLKQEVAYRDDDINYIKLTQDLSNFIEEAFNPSVIQDMIQRLCSSNATVIECEQVDGKLVTFDNFFSRICSNYPLLRDITSSFLYSLSFMTRCLRILNVQVKKEILNKHCNEDVTKILTDIVSFPAQRDTKKPFEHIPRLRKEVESLKPLMTGDSGERSLKKCLSLALKISLLELYNASIISGRVDKQVAGMVNIIVRRALAWWKKQEEEKRRKKEEEESLFKYQAQKHAENETEEETSEREYKEMFPSYDNDFDDLKDSCLDGTSEEMETDEKEDITVDDWLTEQQLWEISETHCTLLTKLPVSPSPKLGDKVKEINFVPAALQRVHILQSILDTIGPVADCDLDQASIGALLVFNHTACMSLLNSHDMVDLIEKPKNIFADATPSEAVKLRPLLVPIVKRLEELLQTWEDHPILALIKRVTERVLDYPVTSPLAKLIFGLETVLAKAELWEGLACREVSLLDHIQKLKKQIVEWRIIELKAWKECLNFVTYNEAVNSKMRWWPHLYECLTMESWNSKNLSKLSQILRDLMDGSTLGDYEPKLQLVLSFHRYLLVSQNSSEEVVHLTDNVFRYYQQFLPLVKSALASKRKEIETKLKEKEEIAKYSSQKFRDLSQIKDKVTKCCDALHSSIRKWKKVLSSNVSEIWAKDSSEEFREAEVGIWDAKKGSIHVAPSCLPPLLPEVEDFVGLGEDSTFNSLKKYTSKARDFIVKVIESLPYSDGVEELESLTSDIIETYLKLTNDAALAGEESDKELRKTKLKNIMTLRRSNIARLFKYLSELGVNYRKGNIEWTAEHFSQCFFLSTYDPEIISMSDKSSAAFKSLATDSDKYFYRCLNRYKLMEESLVSPHDDLNPDLIKRMRGVSKHMLLLLMNVKEGISSLAQEMHAIKTIACNLEDASPFPIASSYSLISMVDYLHSSSLSLASTVSEVIALVSTKTSGSLVPTSQQSYDDITISRMQTILHAVESVCKEIATKSSDMLADLRGFNQVVCEHHMDSVANMNHRMQSAAESLSAAVTLLDPEQEGHLCLTRQPIKWLQTWSEVHRTITSWLDNPKADVTMQTGIAKSDAARLDNSCQRVMVAIQNLFLASQEAKIGEAESLILKLSSHGIMKDIEKLNLSEICRGLCSLVQQISDGTHAGVQEPFVSLSPMLFQLSSLSENLLLNAVACKRSLAKLLSVLLGIFYKICLNGFCRPKDLEEQEGSGKGQMSFEDDDNDAAGLAEGEGEKDMSDKLESEDQLESALKEGEKEKPGDKDLEEQDGVEMSEDFEGKMQDVDQDEKGEDDEEEEGHKEEKNMDDQMGQTDKGSETLDKKLWDDEDKPENEGDQELEEENGDAGEQERESQILAKEKHDESEEKKNNDGKKDKEDAQEKADKPEEMEEDTRQPNKPNEENDDYNDEFEDPHAGLNKDDDKVPEPNEIPDDVNLEEVMDENEPDENGEEENPLDIEQKSLFPEGKDLEAEEEGEENSDDKDMEDLPEEKNDEENSEEPNIEEMEGTKEDIKAEEVEDDEERKNEHKHNAGPEEEKAEATEEGEKEGDDVEASKDRDTQNQAEAAEIDSKNASKDQTKVSPLFLSILSY